MSLPQIRRTAEPARSRRLALLASAVIAMLLPGSALGQAVIGGCQVFPADNVWNRPIDELPVDSHSAEYMASIGTAVRVNLDPSIPINVAGPEVVARPLAKISYADESDLGPMPVPDNPRIEASNDAHMLVIQTETCRLFEIFGASKLDGGWAAKSTAYFDLRSNRLRPDGWTSTDAAGLPVLPGLLRYEEVKSGQIAHALRFTVPHTQRSYVWPARHFASKNPSRSLPPMGLRIRLKGDFDISGFSPEARVVLLALQKYGAFVADNGKAFMFTATPDDWPPALIEELKRATSDSFEAVDTSEMVVNPNSGRAGPDRPFGQVTVPYSNRIALRLDAGSLFSLVLPGDTILAPFTGMEPGKTVAFRICQDAKGGHRLNWPEAVHGAMAVGLTAGKCSVQSFITATDGLYATGPGVANQ
jgi:hypothetical protein